MRDIISILATCGLEGKVKSLEALLRTLTIQLFTDCSQNQ